MAFFSSLPRQPSHWVLPTLPPGHAPFLPTSTLASSLRLPTLRSSHPPAPPQAQLLHPRPLTQLLLHLTPGSGLGLPSPSGLPCRPTREVSVQNQCVYSRVFPLVYKLLHSRECGWSLHP